MCGGGLRKGSAGEESCMWSSEGGLCNRLLTFGRGSRKWWRKDFRILKTPVCERHDANGYSGAA